MSVEAEDAVKPVVPATTMELPVMGKRKIEDTKDRGTRRNDLIKEKSEKRKEQQRMRTRAKVLQHDSIPSSSHAITYKSWAGRKFP